MDQLTDSCTDCGITSDITDKKSFSCYPESPTHVTYRARLEGTSETDSGSLISLIEDWVKGGASIIVTGVLMTVDKKCSVPISSLSEGECVLPTTETLTTTVEIVNDNSPTSFTSSEGSSDNAAIIGGTVAIVIVLIVAITLVIIVALRLALKNHWGGLPIKKAE